MKNSPPNDPSSLLRYRDSIYATDLLVCAIANLDFFTFLRDTPWIFEEIGEILIEAGFTHIAVTEVAADRTMIVGNKND
jgi:hypothetical protein